MNCECGSERLTYISAKCNDSFLANFDNIRYAGYVNPAFGIGDGDYIEFTFCLDCGRIQGEFPIRNPDDCGFDDEVDELDELEELTIQGD